MNSINGNITSREDFFGSTDPYALISKYGSPLYVYNEGVLRERCREMKGLISSPKFRVSYSTKANANLSLLRIIREEGLLADAMSLGEIYVLLRAGFKPEEILFVSNNVGEDELRFAIDQNILVSVDSLSQLETFGRLAPNGRIVVRFNPGVGAGHHRKVITAGRGTKFGVDPKFVPDVKQILARYQLKLVGVNQHIGSLFMEPTPYLEGAQALCNIAKQFDGLEFVDFGGGFGIPYRKLLGQPRLDIRQLGEAFATSIKKFTDEYDGDVEVHIEPGRYVVAECGVLLGTVHSVKENYQDHYVGTDIGFSTLMRPVLYGSHHDIEVHRLESKLSDETNIVSVVGNICETGDVITEARELPSMREGDILCVLDTGAYGFAMASNYNCRLRPAEVLILKDGSDILIRQRDSLDDLTKHCLPFVQR